MGSLAQLPTDEIFARVLGGDTRENRVGYGEVSEQLRAAHDAAWAATSPRLLELCRVRIAILLGCTAEADARTPGSGVADDVLAAIRSWPTDPRFDPLDRACLAFTEHYVIDVASIDDATVDAVHEHLGDDGMVNFVNALLVVEQRIRLRLIWDRLFGGT
jgi:alkylhydroperoxidase family enzyme